MKRKLWIKIAVSMFLVCLGIGSVYAASTKVSCRLYRGNDSAETDAVGISRSADFSVTTLSYSKAPTNSAVYACWTGWPYTLEQSTIVPIGQTMGGTEYQDKNSNFYLKLWAMFYKNTEASGWIKAN